MSDANTVARRLAELGYRPYSPEWQQYVAENLDTGPPPLRILNLEHLGAQVAEHGVPMHGAPAVGMPLHSNGHLGADLVYVRAGDQFPVHTHPGDHLLLSIGGRGTITVADVTYDVVPGDIYMVDGAVPHAVGASAREDHVLVAIGAPHKAVDSPERMAFTDWEGRPVDEPLLPTSVIAAQLVSVAEQQIRAAAGIPSPILSETCGDPDCTDCPVPACTTPGCTCTDDSED